MDKRQRALEEYGPAVLALLDSYASAMRDDERLYRQGAISSEERLRVLAAIKALKIRLLESNGPVASVCVDPASEADAQRLFNIGRSMHPVGDRVCAAFPDSWEISADTEHSATYFMASARKADELLGFLQGAYPDVRFTKSDASTSPLVLAVGNWDAARDWPQTAT